LGPDEPFNFNVKSMIIASSPRNIPIVADNFTTTDEFPYYPGPDTQL
jgi:hypothetical protein